MTPKTASFAWNRALTAVSIAALLLFSAAPHATARTVGVQQGDSFVFNYTVFTTYATPNGNNISSAQDNQFSVSVLWTNASAPLGEVAYSEVITEVNGTTVNAKSAIQNITTIFDPYDNDTYLGNIGFEPFVYTDLGTGSTHDLQIYLTVGNAPGGPATGEQMINATVARGAGDTINVNFTTFSPSVPPTQTVLRYNATTGVLMQGRTYTHFFGAEKNFIYTLIGSSRPTQDIINSGIPILVIFGVIVVVAFATVWKVTSRGPRVSTRR